MAVRNLLDQLVTRLVPSPGCRRPWIVGLTGSVAVGKSTLAAGIVDRCRTVSPPITAVAVSTDSFLLPNRVLEARGLTLRKGFPESFDLDALTAFVTAARAARPNLDVPVYDHFTYDIVDGRRQPVPAVDLLIVEGLAVLEAPVAPLWDVSVYLDADHGDLERWYAERFVDNAHRARSEPGGFWDLFVHLDDDALASAATLTWSLVNEPNLVTHILPARARADIVVTKGPDHRLVALHSRPAGSRPSGPHPSGGHPSEKSDEGPGG